ncbi:response regulator transcription factor [Micromonospora sp. NPDC047793]|nr:response regulator transcription factor [Verrucosispora sp. SN26_14.1]TBL45482.1 response regulator transcription factor [Verrucosispora sp. SN26_14.1]
MIRVLVVDDDPLVRVGLSLVLSASGDMEVVGEAGDGRQALEAVSRLAPDVVLMDIRMSGMDGLSATEALRASDAHIAVVVITTFDTDEHILRALRAGASGFLLKDTPPLEIIDSVRRVAVGESMLSPTVIKRLIDHVVRADVDTGRINDRTAYARAALARLNEREREVAEAIGAGRSNAEISAMLYMSLTTVKAYVSRILAKLECTNRVQVAILVYEARG